MGWIFRRFFYILLMVCVEPAFLENPWNAYTYFGHTNQKQTHTNRMPMYTLSQYIWAVVTKNHGLGGLYKPQKFISHSLKTGSPRSCCQHGWISSETLLPVADCLLLLFISTWQKEKSELALWTLLLRAHTPFKRAESCHITTSQRPQTSKCHHTGD